MAPVPARAPGHVCRVLPRRPLPRGHHRRRSAGAPRVDTAREPARALDLARARPAGRRRAAERLPGRRQARARRPRRHPLADPAVLPRRAARGRGTPTGPGHGGDEPHPLPGVERADGLGHRRRAPLRLLDLLPAPLPVPLRPRRAATRGARPARPGATGRRFRAAPLQGRRRCRRLLLARPQRGGRSGRPRAGAPLRLRRLEPRVGAPHLPRRAWPPSSRRAARSSSRTCAAAASSARPSGTTAGSSTSSTPSTTSTPSPRRSSPRASPRATGSASSARATAGCSPAPP